MTLMLQITEIFNNRKFINNLLNYVCTKCIGVKLNKIYVQAMLHRIFFYNELGLLFNEFTTYF